MKRAAFRLVAFVVATQLALVAGTLAACFIYETKECTGDKISELLAYISAQTFALYASEK
tara:strand:+ start:82 stop:261 length:180 start_codon:yes stop_codon:yes gene_type:complete